MRHPDFVADTGSGILPGSEERIFESYYTTKPQGLGLGLSLSRSILVEHGGNLWAENRPRGVPSSTSQSRDAVMTRSRSLSSRLNFKERRETQRSTHRRAVLAPTHRATKIQHGNRFSTQLSPLLFLPRLQLLLLLQMLTFERNYGF